MELLYLIDENLQMLFPPQIRVGSHLVTKVAEKFSRIGNLLPDLGEEGSPPERIAQDDAVHLRAQPGEQIIRIFVLQGHRTGQA